MTVQAFKNFASIEIEKRTPKDNGGHKAIIEKVLRRRGFRPRQAGDGPLGYLTFENTGWEGGEAFFSMPDCL